MNVTPVEHRMITDKTGEKIEAELGRIAGDAYTPVTGTNKRLLTDSVGLRILAKLAKIVGFPKGGTTGQVLRKKSGTDFDLEWGNAGSGLPAGGSAGQILTKKSATDYDAEWKSAGSTLPSGGTAGQFLKKNSSTDGDASWANAQSAVNDPTASGNSVEFIATLSQGTDGVINPTKKTVRTMGAAASGSAGTTGLVPAPAAGDQEKFLRGDGTWQDGSKKPLWCDFGTISSLPTTKSFTGITGAMRPISWYAGNPKAFTSVLTVVTSDNGTVTLNGTMASSESTTLIICLSETEDLTENASA